jgi:hypothetical protein
VETTRRDNKGRILFDNEYQRFDGRYEYRYYDKDGKRASVYSWRLLPADRTPRGKRAKDALREMEQRIGCELGRTQASSSISDATLHDYFILCRDTCYAPGSPMYTTYASYYIRFLSAPLGNCKIQSITPLALTEVYAGLVSQYGCDEKTIGIINSVLVNVFAFATEQGVIGSNPALYVYEPMYWKRIFDAATKTATVSSKRHGVGDTIDAEADIPIHQRFALTIPEAAVYFRLGQNKIRRLLKETPDENLGVEVGGHKRVCREAMEAYYDKVRYL